MRSDVMREGVHRRHDPSKMTSEPPDLQNDLQAPRNCLPASMMSLRLGDIFPGPEGHSANLEARRSFCGDHGALSLIHI